MASNQAAWLDGPNQELRIGPAAMPTPANDEVVIRNHAVAINPVDWKIQDTGMMVQQWPKILGMDVAGDVHDVGADVERFQKGDRIVARLMPMASTETKYGAFQLYSVASANRTAKLPDSVPFAEAAVLPTAFDTALVGLSSPLGLGLGLPPPSLEPKPSGKTIVLWGGSSSVGAQTIQLARAAGVEVIATASEHNFDFCKKCGATEVFDYKKPSIVNDIVQAVRSSSGEFAGIYDAVSVAEQSYIPSISILEQLGGGNLIVTLPSLPDPPPDFKVTRLFGAGPISYPFYEHYITRALDQGKLKCLPEPLIVGQGLVVVQKALAEQKKGVSAKKVVLML